MLYALFMSNAICIFVP